MDQEAGLSKYMAVLDRDLTQVSHTQDVSYAGDQAHQ